MGRPVLRVARPDDAQALVGIYAHYVEKTAISFEWEPPSVEEFAARMRRTLETYPYLVVERSDRICGYAYAGAFVGRAAYAWSAETTIYLREDERGHGLGARLYQALENVLRAQGVLNLYACIGCTSVEDEYLTNASQRFHTRYGFREVGTFHDCGRKFGRWYDMMWMEKVIGSHAVDASRVIAFSELSSKTLATAGVGKTLELGSA